MQLLHHLSEFGILDNAQAKQALCHPYFDSLDKDAIDLLDDQDSGTEEPSSKKLRTKEAKPT